MTSFKMEVIEKIAALITAAFGLVAALAWNQAIQTMVKQYIGSADELMGYLIYAIIVTILAVVMTIWIARVASKLEKKEAESK